MDAMSAARLGQADMANMAGNESVLANFFNSLLQKRTNLPPQANPLQPAPTGAPAPTGIPFFLIHPFPRLSFLSRSVRSTSRF